MNVDKDAAGEDGKYTVDVVAEVLMPIGSALEAYEVLMVDVRGFVLLLLEEELAGVVYVGRGGWTLLSELEVPVGRAEDWLLSDVVVG